MAGILANVLIVNMEPLLTIITRDSGVIIQDVKATGTTWKSCWSWIQLNLSRNCYKQQGHISQGQPFAFCFIRYSPPRVSDHTGQDHTPGWCKHKQAITRLPNVCGTIKVRVCRNGRSVTSGQGQRNVLCVHKKLNS